MFAGNASSMPKLRGARRHQRLRLWRGWLVFAGLLATAGCRDSLLENCTPDYPGCSGVEGTVSDFENILNANLGDAGYGASLVLHNVDGTAGSVAYQARDEAGNTELQILTWEGNQFEVETIASDAGPYTALVRNPGTGRRAVAYYEQVGGALHIAQEGEGGWIDTIVDNDSEAGLFVDAAIDALGGIHLAYIEAGDADLRYALWQDGAVTLGPTVVDSGVGEELTPGGEIAFRTSIALKPNGEPVISYYDATNGQLRTARFQTLTQTWEIEVIGRFESARQVFPSADGLVTIPGGEEFVPRKSQLTLFRDLQELEDSAFTIRTNKELEIAAEFLDLNAEYTLDFVRPYSGDYGRWSATAVGIDGAQITVFYDFSSGNLVAASNSSPGSSPQWRFEVIDSTGITGDFNDIGLVPQFNADGLQTGTMPVVSYFDQSNGNLRFAFRQSGVWQTTTLDAPGIVGLGTALAVSETGWVVVAYRTFEFSDGTSRLRLIRTVPVR